MIERWGRGARVPITDDYFYDRVYMDPNCGCWIWLLSIGKDGYGSCNVQGYSRAHRLSYAHYRGQVPDGYDLHHMCANRCCANPWHLQAVSHQDHAKIDSVRYEARKQRPFCANGHPRTPENLYPAISATGRPYHQCRICRKHQQDLNTIRRREKVALKREQQRKAEADAWFARASVRQGEGAR